MKYQGKVLLMNKLTHLFLSLLMLLTVAFSTSQPADAKHCNKINNGWNKGSKTGWNKGCNKTWNKKSCSKTGWNKNNSWSKQNWRTSKKQGNYYQKQSQFAKTHNAVSNREANRLSNKYRKAF